jgi:arginase family enzyme
MEEVYQAGNLVSMDLVEVNPALGGPQDVARTGEAVKQLLIHAFGYHRAGIPYPGGASQIPKPRD